MEQVVSAVNTSAPVVSLHAQPEQTLIHDQTVQTPDLRTEKFKHYDRGIEVLGSGVYYHESIGNSETGQISSHLAIIKDSEFNTSPKLSPSQAIEIAESLDLGGKSTGNPALKILPANKKILRFLRRPRLIYLVNLDDGKQFWIDANQGSHLATLPSQNQMDAVPIRVMSAQDDGIQVNWLTSPETGKSSDPGAQNPLICQIAPIAKAFGQNTYDEAVCKNQIAEACEALNENGNPLSFNPASCPEVATSGPSADPSAVRASENAQKFLQYFLSTHGRDSFDDKGSAVVSIVHATQQFGNAIWFTDRQFVAYSDGDGTTVKDFTYALDIAAHELTHGIVQHTAGLIMMGETGALNESIADFFGKMVEAQGDWTMGHGLGIHPDFPGIRDLKEPARIQGQFLDSAGNLQEKPYPSVRADEAPTVFPCTVDNDFCAVHFNATIPGHAWYEIDQRLGEAKTEKLLYLTLTHFLTEFSDFEGAAQATTQACSQILSEKDCRQVREVLVLSGMISS